MGPLMKRRLLIAAIFLLAGAVVNVAVAWGCGLSFYTGTGFKHVTVVRGRPPVDWWGEDPPEGFALHSTHGFFVSSMPGVELAIAKRIHDRLITEHMFRVRTGWPWVSLEDVAWSRDLQTTYLPGRRRPPWLLYRPLWPGFAVNSLLYAAVATVLWVLCISPILLRRFVRVKRGLCPACAYPVGESVVCTECGNALPGRAKVTT